MVYFENFCNFVYINLYFTVQSARFQYFLHLLQLEALLVCDTIPISMLIHRHKYALCSDGTYP